MKLLGHELALATHSIPLAKSEFKHWLVSCFTDVVRSQTQISSLQPPARFAASADEPNPKSNHLLVTASFGRILRKGQLELFSPGRRLNVHPSLLPHYRGPAPIQHALLNGERETGVCVIEMLKMKAGPVDSGDIWGSDRTVSEVGSLSTRQAYRADQQIPDGATFHQLRNVLGRQGGDLLVSVLRKMSRSTVCHPPFLSLNFLSSLSPSSRRNHRRFVMC